MTSQTQTELKGASIESLSAVGIESAGTIASSAFQRQENKGFEKKLRNFIRRAFRFISSFFTLPIGNEVIDYTRNLQEQKRDHKQPPLSSIDTEKIVNFEPGEKEKCENFSGEVFELIDQLDYVYNKKISKYPGWKKSNLKRVALIFEIMDLDRDGMISFADFSDVLQEYNDKTKQSVKKRIFFQATSKKGLMNFEEFCDVFFSVTEGGKDRYDLPQTNALGHVFLKMEYNLAAVSSMNVGDQIRCGVF